ncbi:uncharacterized protein LOC117107087 [Anneissia japonica]|uniref:uncharacterized protein LOC117107087 n=1 Tax=Anneissia japonica TaxID=1529436 RepID=UPI0014257C57|nr:uncharacterized protein LOC117107087 [Anneissia japonica]
MDEGKLTALVLLDMSAAFDTVDHSILLARLSKYIGVKGRALEWCRSYLSHRPQHVCVGEAVSEPVFLNHPVPQGSVLGPQWFTIYIYPIRDIISRYNLSYHVYADDTQIYLSFKPTISQSHISLESLENCISELCRWMKQNFLKLNDEKTEYILIGSRRQLEKLPQNYLTIGESQIYSSPLVRNLGVIMDSTLTMSNHISKTTSTSSFHIRNIRSIRKYIDKTAAEQLVHSFVTSRLDMGNSLLYGLPQKHLHRLQLIQNMHILPTF